MLPAEVLAIWSDCCTGIRWYLYADTLLCANGYGDLPETLSSAQIAVYAADLMTILQQVFPKLPSDWQPDLHQFCQKRGPLLLQKEGQPLLEIHILSPAATPEDAESLSADIRRLQAKTHRKHLWQSLLQNIFGKKPFLKKIRKIDRSAAQSLAALASRYSKDAPYFCDHLTNKEGILLTREQLLDGAPFLCGQTLCPRFQGQEDYLREVYGDYRTGLIDEIGCGLTAEDKEALKRHQQHCRQALGCVQTLAEEFGLRYYLLAGSVLGSLRHQGFIPWDDDIDIGIRIEDLPRFESIIKEHLPKRLPKEFALFQTAPRNGYPRMFSKICYEGRCCLDLWPLVPTYTGGFKAAFTWYFAKIITKVHYKKLGEAPTRFEKLVNLMSFFMTDKTVLRFARWNERKYKKKKIPAYINLYSIYRREKETILRRWLDTPAQGEFEGISVPIVGCTEEYLTHMYGNYMTSPPPWKRASRHVDRFDETK